MISISAAARALIDAGNYEETKKIFAEQGDYENSASFVSQCDYNSASALFEASDYKGAFAIFETIPEFKDSQNEYSGLCVPDSWCPGIRKPRTQRLEYS